MSPTSIALRPAAAAKKLAISVSTLYSRVRSEADFPRPIKAGPRTTVFLERDLDAWLAARAAASKA